MAFRAFLGAGSATPIDARLYELQIFRATGRCHSSAQIASVQTSVNQDIRQKFDDSAMFFDAQEPVRGICVLQCGVEAA